MYVMFWASLVNSFSVLLRDEEFAISMTYDRQHVTSAANYDPTVALGTINIRLAWPIVNY